MNALRADQKKPLLGALRPLHIDSGLWRGVVRSAVRYGPLPWLRYTAPVVGVGLCALLGERREHVRSNLERALGPRPRFTEWADTAKVFANFASCLTETFLAGSERGCRASVRSPNDGQHFREAQAAGRGVIVATANTAGWDVAGPALGHLQNAEVMVVMEPEADGFARQLHDDNRERLGVKVVHAGTDPLAALPLLHHLRRRGVVALKFDRSVAGMRCREVQLFGKRWQIPAGVFALAAVSGAPIMPVFTRRLGFLEYEFVSFEPFFIERRASESRLQEAAQHLASLLEAFVVENPAQWFRFGESG